MNVYSNMLNCISGKTISKRQKSEKKGFNTSKIYQLISKIKQKLVSGSTSTA